jgi:ADP-ribose pyrophosphatase YjhB (NUDIX family)
MIEQTSLTHHIQKHIVGALLYQKVGRFSQLCPPRVDTNLFSYHLKSLIRDGYVDKIDQGYTLSANGLAYVDRLTGSTMTVRPQPKIITMLLVQNGDGQVLLQKRQKQPYIDTWTLPYGKIHIDDPSIVAAGMREAHEKLSLADQPVRHVGDCYIRVQSNNKILSTTLAHVCRFETDDIVPNDTTQWVEPLDLRNFSLAPAVEQIVTRSFFGDDHFFAEFDETWYN